MRNFILWIILIVCLFSFCNKSCTNDEIVSTPTIAEVKPQPYSEKEIVAIIKKVEKELTLNANEVRKFEKQYNKFLRYHAYGQVSSFDVYETAEIAKKACEDANRRLNNLDLGVDERLPEKAHESLSSAIDDAKTGFYAKAEAYSIAMTYLDNPQNSTIRKFQKQSAIGEGYIQSSAVKIGMVKALYNAPKKLIK